MLPLAGILADVKEPATAQALPISKLLYFVTHSHVHIVVIETNRVTRFTAEKIIDRQSCRFCCGSLGCWWDAFVGSLDATSTGVGGWRSC
jgi:hypothetical protein